jgi:hypothetical protein
MRQLPPVGWQRTLPGNKSHKTAQPVGVQRLQSCAILLKGGRLLGFM